MYPYRVMLAVIFSTHILCGASQCIDLCAQARQIHEACTGQNRDAIPDGIETRIGRVGKSGARGPPGRPGNPGEVNHTAIDEEINKKFEEIDSKIEARLQELARYDEQIRQASSDLEELKQSNPSLYPRSCQELLHGDTGERQTSGVFAVYANLTRIQVYCDMETDGGGWTVFQRRMDGSVNFTRNWDDYVRGFGSKSGEYWLGLEALHQMTKGGKFELRVDLTNKAGETAYAKYGIFSVAGRSDNYRLNVRKYSGTAGNSLSYHQNNEFSTPDRDNDKWSLNCADDLRGGWWFNVCRNSHLNGEYAGTRKPYAGGVAGVEWQRWMGFESLKAAEMKLRKKQTREE